MEHLDFPRPTNSILDHVEIPYFPPSKFSYDGQGVTGFWDRMSKSGQLQDILNITGPLKKQYFASRDGPNDSGTLEPDHRSEDDELFVAILSLLQNWFYFGLLIDLFGRAGLHISAQDFLRTRADGKQVVTTAHLTRFIHHWHVLACENEAKGSSDHVKHFEQTLYTTEYKLDYFTEDLIFFQAMDHRTSSHDWMADCFSPRFPRAQAVEFSIRLILEMTATCLLAGIYDQAAPEAVGGPDFPVFTSHSRETRLLATSLFKHSKYCSDEIALIQGRCSSLTQQLFFLINSSNVSLEAPAHRVPCYLIPLIAI